MSTRQGWHSGRDTIAKKVAAMADAQNKSVDDQANMPPVVADDELVERALHDRAAFADLYRRHLSRVYRYALAQTGGDTQQAQDITAQTFLAAIEKLDTYRHTGAFISWLLTIARHKATDLYRSRREAASLEEAAQLASPEPSPERIVTARLELAQVLRTLQVLAPDRAEALALRIFGQLTTAEIAVVMEKSEAAVKMLVHRAIGDLRERLGQRIEAEL